MKLHRNPNNGGNGQLEAHRFSEDLDDSTCSTPYVSAPSSPGRSAEISGYFFSAPASPVHYMLSSSARTASYGRHRTESKSTQSESPAEFDFASKLSPNSSAAVGSMSSADELFCNGQIRPMKLSSHLQRPQILAPLIDLDLEEEEDEIENIEVENRGRDLKLRSRSLHRKARSLSPLRTPELHWTSETTPSSNGTQEDKAESNGTESASIETTPSSSTSSSRSSSSGRNSKKWIFLKDLLNRSKSEGRAQGKERFWPIVSFSKPPPPPAPPLSPAKKKPANGISKRRSAAPSAHEVHYTKNRAQAEEMKKRTYLPYRQGLLGCLGFSSKGYGALSKTLNPVSSR